MSTLTEDRSRAIEQSGWGEEFHLVQPQNLAFWVYCLLVAAGVLVISGQVSIAAAGYSGALTSGIIAFGLMAVACRRSSCGRLRRFRRTGCTAASSEPGWCGSSVDPTCRRARDSAPA